MSADLLPHVDRTGRGLADGTCSHCGASGSLDTGECEARLRSRVDELEALLADTAAWRIRDALPFGAWRDALDRAIPLDDLRCPLCGSDVIWSCQGTPGAVARAHCGRGMYASRVGSVGEQACPWKGTRIARLASLAVVALYPVEVARG